MLYCFVKEDLFGDYNDEELMIQAQYAKYIEKYILFELCSKRFFDTHNFESVAPKDLLFVRCNYEYAERVLSYFDKQNIRCVETIENREKIFSWALLGLTKRNVFIINHAELGMFLKNYEAVNCFLKSRKKGYSMVLDLNERNEIEKVVKQVDEAEEDVIFSDYAQLYHDEFGTCEVRFFILFGKILNYSRYVHSIKHKVDVGFIKAAEEILNKIRMRKEFPSCFVLDIGEFIGKKGKYYDVVEINPVTTSLCYVNNSIFLNGDKNLSEMNRKIGFGLEYCFDMIQHGNLYYFDSDRKSEFVYLR